MSVSGMSGSAGSLPMRCTTSARKPSTPRSSQKRSTSCIAATTSGLSQLRSGCWGRKVCRYHCPVASSHVHAGPPPKAAGQLLGGRSGAPSCQRYQSRFGRVARRAALDEPRVLVGGVVGDPVQQHADVARVRVGEQARRRRRGRRRAGRRRSSRPRRSRSRPSASGRSATATARRRRATAGGRAARAARRGRRRRRPTRRRTSAGRSGRRRPLATTCGGEGYGPATTKAVRVPPMAEVEQIGVVGAGFMGSGIAESAARAGVAVVKSTSREAAAARALALHDRGLGRARGQARQAHRRRGATRCSGASSGRPTSTRWPSPSSSSRRSSRTRRSRRGRSRTSTPRSAPRRSSPRTPRRSRSPAWRPPPDAPIACWGCTSSRRCRS